MFSFYSRLWEMKSGSDASLYISYRTSSSNPSQRLSHPENRHWATSLPAVAIQSNPPQQCLHNVTWCFFDQEKNSSCVYTALRIWLIESFWSRSLFLLIGALSKTQASARSWPDSVLHLIIVSFCSSLTDWHYVIPFHHPPAPAWRFPTSAFSHPPMPSISHAKLCQSPTMWLAAITKNS